MYKWHSNAVRKRDDIFVLFSSAPDIWRPNNTWRRRITTKSSVNAPRRLIPAAATLPKPFCCVPPSTCWSATPRQPSRTWTASSTCKTPTWRYGRAPAPNGGGGQKKKTSSHKQFSCRFTAKSQCSDQAGKHVHAAAAVAAVHTRLQHGGWDGHAQPRRLSPQGAGGRSHTELSGCGWAQPLINTHAQVLVSKACVSLPQLKILLDQVDEAVGDFDECILLRPDSALAQAQKCFALVSRNSEFWMTTWLMLI